MLNCRYLARAKLLFCEIRPAVGTSLQPLRFLCKSAYPDTIAFQMENITDIQIEPVPPTSEFLKPLRMTFLQNGRKRFWDFCKLHESVVCVLFNTSRKVLIFVKQFRPAIFYSSAMKTTGDNAIQDVDWTKVSPKLGIALEFCAGIVDAKLALNEVVKKEVLEECGYEVPLTNFQRIICYRSGVGVSGDKVTMFYAECTDEMKVSAGGGIPEEGEYIDVVEMTIPEVRDYVSRDDITSPGANGPQYAKAMSVLLDSKKY